MGRAYSAHGSRGLFLHTAPSPVAAQAGGVLGSLGTQRGKTHAFSLGLSHGGGILLLPPAWQKILEALKVPRLDRGELRRNWYITQMGSYMPGKLWMVLGRLTFLKMNGISAVKGVTSIVLENIYMLVALGIMSLLALPFLGSDIPGA